MDAQVIAIALPAATVIVWLIRLEGRVNTQEAVIRQFRDDLTYIRTRIDAAINGRE